MKRITRNLTIAGVSILTAGAIVAATICFSNIKKPDVITNGQVNYEWREDLNGYVAIGLSNADKTKIKAINVTQQHKNKEVVGVEKGAFAGCTNLESITLPFIGWRKYESSDLVGSMFGSIFGEDAISGQGGITWQECYGENDVTVWGKHAIPRSLTTVTITDAQFIPAGAFSKCSNLESITINQKNSNASIPTIENKAFYGCTSLFEFNFSTIAGLDTIGRSAFENCYVLGKIDIPSGVKYIASSAFANCISSATTKIPLSVTNVGQYAFKNHIGGIIMIEGTEDETSKTAAWADDWTDSSTSIVYDFKSGNSTVYADDWLTIICGSGQNQYGYLAQWMGSWEQSTITIPSKITYNGKDIPIKAIGGKCFYENYYIQALNFEEGVEIIYPNTFQGCSALKYINFPESLKEIRTEAFAGCTSLVGYLDEGVPTNNLHFTDCPNLTLIGDRAFKGCTSLTDILFNNNTEEIGEEAFAYCTHLCCDNSSDPTYALHLPKNCVKLGNGAFKYCFKYAPSNYTASYYYPTVILGENIETIPESCFERCGVRDLRPTKGDDAGTVYPRYVRVNIDLNNAKIRFIKDAAFKECWICNLRNARNTHIEEIGDYAFYYAQPTSSEEGSVTGKQDLQMDQEIKYIGDYAFAYCTTIKSLTFNTEIDNGDGTKNALGYNSLEHLGQYAFYNCNNSEFTEVDLSPCINLATDATVGPDGTIKHPELTPRYAFANCTYLQKVRFPGHKPINATEKAEYDAGKHSWWNKPSADIKFHEISERMFESCALGNDAARTPIYIPEQVTAIRHYAFYNNKTLQEAYIQGVIDYYGTGIFRNNEALKYVRKLVDFTTPSHENVHFSNVLARDRIGSEIYSGCKNLQIAPLPIPTEPGTPASDYYDINSNMYLDNLAMTQYQIPKVIRTIGSSAFQGCTNLTTVTVDDATNSKLAVINSSAFYNCSNLATFDISNTKISSIGNSAFYKCTSLGTSSHDFMLPNNAITMGTRPFEGWDESNQSIKFRINNCVTYNEQTKKWVVTNPTTVGEFYLNGMQTSSSGPWIFTRHGSTTDDYYWTCPLCGNANLKFYFVA